MPQTQATNISANAGDQTALSDPNSPESISRRAQQSQAQTSEDSRYDTTTKSGFQDFIIVWENDQKQSREISMAIFLALGTLLFLYKAAPDRF